MAVLGILSEAVPVLLYKSLERGCGWGVTSSMNLCVVPHVPEIHDVGFLRSPRLVLASKQFPTR